jgi:predicted membrane protein
VDLTTSSIQRPIGGTLAFIAIVVMFVWVLRAHRGSIWDVAQYGMALSLLFLVIGAVLGVLLGLQLAEVEIVAPENAEQLGGAHPAAMVVGYVILAGTALIEWLLRQQDTPSLSKSKAGVVQMSLIFLAGLFAMLGVLLDNDIMLQANVPLEVIGLIILVWRLRAYLAPSQWGGPVSGVMARTAVLGLIIGVVLFAYVVSLFVSGADFEEIVPWLLAVDHINFIMVMTNLIFAMMAIATAVSEGANRLIFWGVNTGVLGFAVGLFTENATLKRIFTPILGVALLYGIYTYLTAKEKQPAVAEVGV